MNELYHHGVKGQRWGVRRYRNRDGSLTPAGKKKYGINDTRNEKEYVPKNGDIRKKFDLDNDYDNQWGKVASLVNEKSMDWYDGIGYTKTAKKIIKEYEDGLNKIAKKYPGPNTSHFYYAAIKKFEKNIYPRVASVVLRDLGYEDTKEAREWMLKHQTIMWN